MLTLYHGDSSVCSVKVRLGLAEKDLAWNSKLLALPKGEQHTPEYLKINPNGVVPTLIDDGDTIFESSVILEYVDELSQENPLMPVDKSAKALTKTWLLRSLSIHAAINTMTFSTVGRAAIIANKTPEQIAHSIAKIPNPSAAKKRKDLIDNGLKSGHLYDAFYTLSRMFDDMQAALEKSTWLAGDTFSLADVALIAYVDRIDRLSMSGLWEKRTPRLGAWLNAAKARPSYAEAIDPFITQEAAVKMRTTGSDLWPEVRERWEAFLKQNP
jgi:glutathione S-transferase